MEIVVSGTEINIAFVGATEWLKAVEQKTWLWPDTTGARLSQGAGLLGSCCLASSTIASPMFTLGNGLTLS